MTCDSQPSPAQRDIATPVWITHPDWVTPGENMFRAPVLASRFDIDRPVRSARLLIAGLGVWTATLDDRPLTDAELEPGVSEFRTRVAATTVDLTGRLAPGRHELIVELGEGSAHVRDVPGRYSKFAEARHAPRLLARLDLDHTDGTSRTLSSDRSWRAALGPTMFTHWYGGEDYDARAGTTAWVDAVELDDPGPSPWTRAAPPVKVVDTLTAVTRTPTLNGFVCDFGVNHAGRPLLTVGPGVPAGTRIELWPAEHLDARGRADQASSGGPVFDTYITGGDAEQWHPSFCYHGYRYIEVKVPRTHADALDLRSQQLMTADRRTGHFSCSDPALQKIHDLTDRAVQSNLMSVPTDCPHREKLGWLEQTHLVFGPVSHLYDVRDHFTDLITHMIDAQTAEGLIPSIAPELVVLDGGFRHDVNWGSTIWRLPGQLWRVYGDLEPARRAWDAGLRYLGYVSAQEKDGLLHDGLADWIALDESTPPPLVHGHGYLAMLASAAALATALGRDPAPFLRDADRVRRRLREEYALDPDRIGSGSQASLALALDAGIVADEHHRQVVHQLAGLVEHDDHASVGEIALPALFRVLGRADRHDLLYRLLTQTHSPGYGAMVRDGNTALAESWQNRPGQASANHFMLGYVAAWLTEDVAGLKQATDSVGWRHAVIAPRGFDLATAAEVSYDSPAGRYHVRWERHENVAEITVRVPEHGRGSFDCPAGYALAKGASGPLPPGEHHLQAISTGCPDHRTHEGVVRARW
ncbi:family 78 glycoside hydrolase catalytic domain [Nonomuraea sp. NPDC050404]|uniref:family 78 glycoside hydrolase catalytic domain n=1 Tax=Nonomuraea sp. NPDC050404 TaxID=3155783 RepID=UPI0033DED43B